MTSVVPTALASIRLPEISREGITVLFDRTESGEKGIDYVFIHGLNGHPKNTWTSANDFYWPWHLKEDLKNARVMVYGYNADFERAWTVNQASIKTIAESFVSAIIDEREDINRPLILIAHSLGGLVVKRALITIHRDRSADTRSLHIQLQNRIYDSIQGLVFLGTPHAGSGVTGKMRVKMLQRLAKASFKKAPEKIMKALEANSDEILELSDGFEKTTIFTRHEISICTYYETRTTKLLGEEVVPEAMTVLHHQQERREGIPANHEDMVKYNDPKDRNYRKVMKELKRMGAYQKLSEATPEDLSSAKMVEKYAEDAREDLERRRFDMKKLKTVPGDFNWFTKLPEYLKWSSAGSAAFLWYADQPRSGKTTLLQNLVVELLDSQWHNREISVAYFFCPESAMTEQSTSESNILLATVLRSIVCQLLYRYHYRIAPLDLGERLEDLLSNDNPISEALWELVRDVIKATPDQETHIIIDGIDNVHPEAQSEFLKRLLKLWRTLPSNPAIVAKFLIAGSPSPEIQDILRGVPVINENIERKHCLDFLFFPELYSRRDRVPEPQKGTYQWIWRHPAYQKWLEKGSGILWVRGKAGCGKTTLAKMIQKKFLSESNAASNKLQNGMRESVVADFFYSSRGGSKETSHTLMLQSLLYQVLEKEPKMFKFFRRAFRRLLGKSTGGVKWPYDELKEILLSLSRDDRLDTPCNASCTIYFLLDAMDESDDQNEDGQHRAEVLSLFSKSCSMNGEIIIKIIITSRPANEIEKTLKGSQRIELEKENDDDIEKVVDAGLRSLWESMNESDEDSDSNSDGDDDMPAKTPQEANQQEQGSLLAGRLMEDDLNDGAYEKELTFVRIYLMEHAHGVILWVVLVLGELLHHLETSGYSMREIKDKLEGLPTNLESTYEEIVGRLLRMNTEEEIAQGRLMLTWVSLAKRPLTVMEFRDAIAVPTGPSVTLSPDFLSGNRVTVSHNNWTPICRRILSRCGGLLDVIRPNSENPPKMNSKTQRIKPTYIVQLLHQSVKDFLLHNSSASPLKIDQTFGQRLIATALLRYLRLSLPMINLQKNPIQEWSQEQYQEFVKYLLDRPLLGYALLSLPQHIGSHESKTGEELAGFLRQLQKEPGHHAWAFLDNWCRAEHLLPSHPPVPSELAKSFRTECLMTASQAGHADVVQTMLEARFDVKGGMILHRAAMSGQEAVARVLLDKGTDVAMIDSNGRTALHEAAKNGHEAVARLLLDKGANVAAVDWEDQTVLHLAAMNGHEAVARVLLHRGADVEPIDSKGETALHQAVKNEHNAVIQLLLDKGANAMAKDNAGWTALHLAAQHKHVTALRLLLDFNAKGGVFDLNIDAVDNSLQTALHMSAAEGCYEAVDILLGLGANAEARNKDGDTALHQAVRPLIWTGNHAPYGPVGETHETTLRIFAKWYVCLEATNRQGMTALYLAVDGRRENLARLLLDLGADINAQGKNILYVPACGGKETMMRLLLEKGANVQATNEKGWTALHGAACNGQEAVVRLLLENGADVNARNEDNMTAQYMAAANGHEAMVHLLECKDTERGLKNLVAMAKLYNAVKSGNENEVRLLVETGVDVKARDMSRCTVLHYAAKEGHEAIVRVLLENGADTKAADSCNWTALRYAAENKHEMIIKLLVKKMVDDIETSDDDIEASDKCTMLQQAASEGYKEVVQLLLDRKAPLEIKKDGFWPSPPLVLAALYGHRVIVQLLLEEGANIEARDNEGQTALHKATEQSRLDSFPGIYEAVVRLLLEKGANVNASDRDGEMALHKASCAGHEEIVGLLLEKGANVNTRDKNGETALHKVSYRWYEERVQMLLDINGRDMDGEAALHEASRVGIVGMLLEKGANIEAKDKNSLTPLFSAAKAGEKAVVQQLLEKGANPKSVDINVLRGVCKHMIRDAQAAVLS